jgi:hypothetical protein
MLAASEHNRFRSYSVEEGEAVPDEPEEEVNEAEVIAFNERLAKVSAEDVGFAMLRADFPDATREDFDDFAARHPRGLDGALSDIRHRKVQRRAEYQDEAPPKSHYVVHWRGDYRNRSPAALLIDDLYIPQTGLGVIAAPTQSFKSFVALEICIAVATGRLAFGTMKVNLTGTALYAAGEGARGIEDQRVLAYERAVSGAAEHGANFDLDAYPFGVIPGLPVAANQSDVSDFLAGVDAAVKARGQPLRVIVLDTLNKMMPGMDENAAGPMAAVLHAVAEALVHRYGCFAVIVHHFGKDKSKAERGSTALRAAADWSAAVEATKDKNADLYLADVEITKDKDGDGEGEHVYLRGTRIELGRPTSKRNHSLVFTAITESEHEALKAGAKPTGEEGPGWLWLPKLVGRVLRMGAFNTDALAIPTKELIARLKQLGDDRADSVAPSTLRHHLLGHAGAAELKCRLAVYVVPGSPAAGQWRWRFPDLGQEEGSDE